MNITQLINRPELLDKETLYELRSMLALHPYCQPARLLMLQNLYILHDQMFDRELKRAAVYLTNRKILFNMVEGVHYTIRAEQNRNNKETENGADENRTLSLIDNFLDSVPEKQTDDKNVKRKPTPVDAAVDYVAYLLEMEEQTGGSQQEQEMPQLKGQSLIDSFIVSGGGKIQLKDEPEYLPQIEDKQAGTEETDKLFTETLSKIYVKQGKYEKALEIIKHLNLNYPKKNAYFADQIRFLEKLIINNKNK